MSNKCTALIIEDERSIQTFLSTILSAYEYKVLKAENGANGMIMLTTYCPDFIILDLGLPDMDGIDFIKSVRKWSSIPIIVVSARVQEKEKVRALDLGADDYLTKPFGASELLARIRTALRHSLQAEVGSQLAMEEMYKVGDLVVDYKKRRVLLNNEDVHLTQSEYRIVTLLSKYAGKVLTYDFLIKSIWGPNASDNNQILRVNMANIRRKIEQNPAEPKYIFTEIGVGYRMLEGDE